MKASPFFTTRNAAAGDARAGCWKSPARVFTLVLVVFFLTIVERVNLPAMLLPSSHAGLQPCARRTPKPKATRADAAARRSARPAQPRRGCWARCRPATILCASAFYVSWDPTSLASLQQHYRDIDLLVPEQLHSITARRAAGRGDDPKLAAWMKSLGIKIPTMPLLNNSDGTIWHVPEMAAMLHNAATRGSAWCRQVVDAHRATPSKSGWRSTSSRCPTESQRDFVAFVGELAAGLHGADLKLMVALPAADGSYDYAAISQQADAIILMNYDDHWLTSPPGPIAPQDWFAQEHRRRC